MEKIKQIQIQQRGSMVCPFETTGFYTDTASPHWNRFVGIKEMFQDLSCDSTSHYLGLIKNH